MNTNTLPPVKAVVLDFDGTISTLRFGWPAIMRHVMLAVLNPTGEANHALETEIDQYIDESCGIQTILQMKWLSQKANQLLGKSEGPWAYKELYNNELLKTVANRRDDVEMGRVPAENYMISGAKRFLQTLKDHGIALYLASGTDEADVRREATALGVASYFTGIHGALERSEECMKSRVMEQLIRESGLPAQDIAILGDGPVEIALGIRLGTRAIGLATDEDARHGIDCHKAERLKKAGATCIFGDFLNLPSLLLQLGISDQTNDGIATPLPMEAIRNNVKNSKIAVIGDFCLDVYWHADMKKSELSRETPHFPLPIVKERMSAGGAGNVVANLLALNPASVSCIGVFGNDWRGDAYRKILEKLGADLKFLFTEDGRITDTYIKPLRAGFTDVVYEDPRLDFTNYSPISEATEKKLLDCLDKLPKDTTLCVCDQMPCGIITPRVREKIISLGEQGMTVIVDSRDRVGLYRSVIVKPNELEGCRALEIPPTRDLAALQDVARALAQKTGRNAILTLGDQGCMTAETNGAVTHIPALPVQGEIDICGAGDTFLSALAIALSAGASLPDAASFGCRCSAITIKKLKMTGTASWDELL